MIDRATDERRHDFFILDNALIDDHAAVLKPHALAVYIAIVRHADRATGRAFPSLDHLAKTLGMCRRKVIDCVKALEEHGLVTVERDKRANIYTLCDLGGDTSIGVSPAPVEPNGESDALINGEQDAPIIPIDAQDAPDGQAENAPNGAGDAPIEPTGACDAPMDSQQVQEMHPNNTIVRLVRSDSKTLSNLTTPFGETPLADISLLALTEYPDDARLARVALVMLERDVWRDAAVSLIENHPLDKLEKALDWYLYRQADPFGSVQDRTLPGWLMWCLRTDDVTRHPTGWVERWHGSYVHPVDDAGASDWWADGESDLEGWPETGTGTVRADLAAVVGPLDMTLQDAWVATMGQLKLQLNRSSFQTWVKGAEAVDYEDGVLIVQVKNAYARDWMEKRSIDTIVRTLADIWGEAVGVRFVTAESEGGAI